MSLTSDSNRPGRLQRTGGPGFAWDVKPSMNEELFEAALSGDPGALPLDRWQEEGRLEVVKTGRHRTVYRLALPGAGSDTTVYIKRYRAADWKARWRR
ncbi:MAG: hypothetical protein VYA62_12005, partial [Planctomycetota bacterium]|nr:hypothetical protein [Planctomycetota bacterium]